MKTQKKLLSDLLLHKASKSRLWFAWGSLCAGTTLLLLSVMIWWNFRELLYGRNENDSLGATFLTISKKVTDENMGRPDLTVFSQSEMKKIGSTPQVNDVGVLTSNRFPAYITLHSHLDFSSEIFLESVPDRFIDKRPKEWVWQAGTRDVPIILSTEFLNLYNYGFALSQGLPQLSPSSLQSLAFDLVLGPPDLRETYSAHIAGFSDRISSVLVPQNFMEFANQRYGKVGAYLPSRLIVNVKDPSDKSFTKFLEDNNYVANTELLKWNKLRAVVDIIAGATGLLAMLLMGISILVFTLFIELTIVRAQQSLALLLQLGYHPAYLKRFMLQRFVPLMLSAALIAMLLAIIAQFGASRLIVQMNLRLSVLPGYPVWGVALASVLLLFFQISNSVQRALKKI